MRGRVLENMSQNLVHIEPTKRFRMTNEIQWVLEQDKRKPMSPRTTQMESKWRRYVRKKFGADSKVHEVVTAQAHMNMQMGYSWSRAPQSCLAGRRLGMLGTNAMPPRLIGLPQAPFLTPIDWVALDTHGMNAAFDGLILVRLKQRQCIALLKADQVSTCKTHQTFRQNVHTKVHAAALSADLCKRSSLLAFAEPNSGDPFFS